MIINDLDSTDFDYDLPDERIARYPLPERDGSKLLVWRRGDITDAHFSDICDYLPEGSTLVRNDTKVIRARLRFVKTTGAVIEVFCLEPVEPVDIQLAFGTHEPTTWTCIVGNSKRWKDAPLTMLVMTNAGQVTLTATRISTAQDSSQVRFSWDNQSVSFAEIIDSAGVMPIPPYLCRETEEIDNMRYQTVYSQHKGSVAAPTAGLHFTQSVLDDVAHRHHPIVNVTLHVGAGTFRPIQTSKIADHVMHTEHIVVTRDALEQIVAAKGNIVAVGTTSVRTLESLYWLGVKIIARQDISNGLGQWEAYELPQDIDVQDALTAVLRVMGQDDYFCSQTQIMIVPSYRLRVVRALITNFHQPHSTLLLLIGAIVGDQWRDIYSHALQSDYRFLSYGDSSLLIP